MKILSFVSAVVGAEHRADIEERYREAIAAGLPSGIEQTLMLAADDGTIAIATVWKSREALDEMLASGEEPLARRLLREGGGEPTARLFEIAAEGHSAPG